MKFQVTRVTIKTVETNVVPVGVAYKGAGHELVIANKDGLHFVEGMTKDGKRAVAKYSKKAEEASIYYPEVCL